MQGQPKTSFIPKKPIQNTGAEISPVRPGKKKARTLLSLIATIIFLGTLAALAGVFFYQFTLEKRIEE